MTAALELIYSEYGRDKPPLVWLPSDPPGASDRSAAHEIIAAFRKRGVRRRWTEGVCVRIGPRILVRTTSGLSDKDGGRHAAIVVISGLRAKEDWDDAVVDQVADVLEATGIHVFKPLLCTVLPWSAASSATALRWILRSRARAIRRYILRLLGGKPS